MSTILSRVENIYLLFSVAVRINYKIILLSEHVNDVKYLENFNIVILFYC